MSSQSKGSRQYIQHLGCVRVGFLKLANGDFVRNGKRFVGNWAARAVNGRRVIGDNIPEFSQSQRRIKRAAAKNVDALNCRVVGGVAVTAIGARGTSATWPSPGGSVRAALKHRDGFNALG